MSQSDARAMALERIKSLFKSERIEFTDVDNALDSLSECAQPTKLIEIYLNALMRGNHHA